LEVGRLRTPRNERSIATSDGMHEYWRRPGIKRLRFLGAKARRIERFIAVRRSRAPAEFIEYHEHRLADVVAEIDRLKERS
jgi:hypothetical protein